MRTPLVVVTGVDEAAMDATLLSLSWDFDRAVSVRHRIDVVTQTLTRVVSDATGVLERADVPLAHACVDCALREDVLPTLHRLAAADRWSAIVAGLPVAAEADQLSAVLGRDARLARRLRLAAVVAALGPHPVGDLLGDEALAERHLHTSRDDDRGLGEVASAQVELADVVVMAADTGPGPGLELVRALARPDATVVVGTDRLDGGALARGRHSHGRAVDWAYPDAETRVPPLPAGGTWRLDLGSPRPFHPERLLDRIESLGAGRHRSRGCFWLPTRPGVVQQWAGAGAQLSIGSQGVWGRRTPVTRLVMTGLGTAPSGLADAFDDLLVTPEEALLDGHRWDVVEDGLEPWLGDVRDAA